MAVSGMVKCGVSATTNLDRNQLMNLGVSWFHVTLKGFGEQPTLATTQDGLQCVPVLTRTSDMRQLEELVATDDTVSWVVGLWGISTHTMPVNTAIDTWEDLAASVPKHCRLGSHVIKRSAGWDYSDRIIAGIRDRKLRLDAICLQGYFGKRFNDDSFDVQDNARRLAKYVDDAHARYGLPVWVMDLRLDDFNNSKRRATSEENMEFLRLVHAEAVYRRHFARLAVRDITLVKHAGNGSSGGGGQQEVTQLGRTMHGLVSASKRGVGTGNFPNVASALSSCKASWFYNWMPNNFKALPAPPPAQFIPMLWDEVSINNIERWSRDAFRAQPLVLGFNEIDQVNQANMTPEKAAELWKRVVDLAAPDCYLVSPCVAGDYAALDKFMTLVRSRGLRVDAVACHIYTGWNRGPDFDCQKEAQLVGKGIDRLWKQYGLPVWLTEVGLVDYSKKPVAYANTQQNSEFLAYLVPELDRRPYLERWAWFRLPKGGHEGLADPQTNGQLTELGKQFAALPS